MGDLQYSPLESGSLRFSAGTLTDFVSSLTADPSAEPRPSLSEYFNEKGVDAGIAFHRGPKVYAEANPWTMNELETPEDGADGTMTQRHGHLSFGIESDLNDDHVGYVEGKYSVTFGHAGWTPPETVTTELPIFDDEGNEIDVETYVDEYDGYHDFDGPVTTLSLVGNAYTDGEFHIAGIAEHERTINISGRDFDLNALGAIGIDSDYGGFVAANGEISTLIHADTATSLYAGASVMIAGNDEYSHNFVEAGVETSFLEKVTGLSAIPALRTGIQYDGNEVKPVAGIGWDF